MELSWGIDLWDRLDEMINHSTVTSNFIDKFQKCLYECQNIWIKAASKQKRSIEKLKSEINHPDFSEFTMTTGLLSIINNFTSIYSIKSTFATSITATNDDIFKKSHSQIKKDTATWINEKRKMEESLAKQRRKYDLSLRRYREKYNAMSVAQETYKKCEENKNYSRAQLDLSNQALQSKKDEYDQSKQLYAVEFRDFNQTQKLHFDVKVVKWAKKGEEIYNQKLQLIKDATNQFSKLTSDMISKLNYSVTRFSDVAKQVDFVKDAILLIQKYKTGDVPPLELQFIDMDFKQYSSKPSKDPSSDDTSEASDYTSSNESFDVPAPKVTQNHSTSNSSIYTNSFSHDNKSDPIRPTVQNMKSKITATSVNPEAKFSLRKPSKLFKSSTPWKTNVANNLDSVDKPTARQPSLYQRRGRNSTRQSQPSRRSRSVTDMISDVIRSSMRLKSKNDKSPVRKREQKDRSPSRSQIVSSRQSISDFDSDTDINQSGVISFVHAPEIVSTPAEAVAEWKRKTSEPNFRTIDRQYASMVRPDTPPSVKTNSQSDDVYQIAYVGSCVSNHDYDSDDLSNGYLSFKAGDQFYIVKMDDGSGWLFVDTVDQTSRGYVPSSYMKICHYDTINDEAVV